MSYEKKNLAIPVHFLHTQPRWVSCLRRSTYAATNALYGLGEFPDRLIPVILRQCVLTRFQPIEIDSIRTLGDGGLIHMVPTKGNREIAPLAAWPILSARLTDSEMAGVVEIGVGRLEDAIKAKAPRGKGAGMIRPNMATMLGFLASVAGTAAIYDNAAATATNPLVTALPVAAGWNPIPVAFGTGLYIVLTTAAGSVVWA